LKIRRKKVPERHSGAFNDKKKSTGYSYFEVMVIVLHLNERVIKVRRKKKLYTRTAISPVVQIHSILLGAVPVKTVNIADILDNLIHPFLCYFNPEGVGNTVFHIMTIRTISV
jgi:hypothetical protein